MNKNIEPGKTLWYLRDGIVYLWLCFSQEKENGLGNLQGVLALAPDIPVSDRQFFWYAVFSFRRLVVASGHRGGARAI